MHVMGAYTQLHAATAPVDRSNHPRSSAHASLVDQSDRSPVVQWSRSENGTPWWRRSRPWGHHWLVEENHRTQGAIDCQGLCELTREWISVYPYPDATDWKVPGLSAA